MNKLVKEIYPAIKTKQCLVTFCTTFVIALALIFVIAKNKSVEASFTDQTSIAELETVAEEYENAQETPAAETAESDDNLHQITVKSGDTLLTILTGLGISYNDADPVFAAIRKVFDPRDLRIGQNIEIETTKADEKLMVKRLTSTIRTGEHLNVTADEKWAYSAQIIKDELIEEIKSVSGKINGTLSVSMNNNGVPSKIVANFINIFSYSVDFRRDVKKGDSYEIMYEDYLTSDGKLARHGDIVYASIMLGKNKIELYRFKDKNGNADYYNEKGLALKKTLMRRPMEHQSGRISSYFGRRRHPIYKDVRVHWGVDYPAPRGSRIFAAGDGVVEVAQYRRGYGNYIKIRHNSEYSTAYGHMNGYAKGIHAGVRVKQGQTIGYVGTSGRSTGPHLHYEVLRNGQRIDPLKVKASASENLSGQNLTNFKRQLAKIQDTRKNMTAAKEQEKKVAETPKDNQSKL